MSPMTTTTRMQGPTTRTRTSNSSSRISSSSSSSNIRIGLLQIALIFGLLSVTYHRLFLLGRQYSSSSSKTTTSTSTSTSTSASAVLSDLLSAFYSSERNDSNTNTNTNNKIRQCHHQDHHEDYDNSPDGTMAAASMLVGFRQPTLEERRDRMQQIRLLQQDPISTSTSTSTSATSKTQMSSTSSSSSSSSTSSISMLFYPALLAHPNPKHILYVTTSTSPTITDDNDNDNDNDDFVVGIIENIVLPFKEVERIGIIHLVLLPPPPPSPDQQDCRQRPRQRRRRRRRKHVSGGGSLVISEHWISSLSDEEEDFSDFYWDEGVDGDDDDDDDDDYNDDRTKAKEEGYEKENQRTAVNLILVDANAATHFDTVELARWCENALEAKKTEEKGDEGETLTSSNSKSNSNSNSNAMLLIELPGSAGSVSAAERRMEWVDALQDGFDRLRDFDVRLPVETQPQQQQQQATTTNISATASRAMRQRGMRNYVLAFHDAQSEAFWYLNEAEWNRVIRSKVRDSLWDDHDESSLLLLLHLLVDSASMQPLIYTSKESEVEFCRRTPLDERCQVGGSGLDSNMDSVPMSDLVIQQSQIGEFAGRGLFTKVDIPPNAFIGAEQTGLYLNWKATEILFALTEMANAIYEHRHEELLAYFDGYGFIDESATGMPFYEVDGSAITFVNHGCKGTNNVHLLSIHHEGNLEIPKEYYHHPKKDDQNNHHDDKNGDDDQDDDEDDDEDTLYTPAEEEALWKLIPAEYLKFAGDVFYLPVRNPAGAIPTQSNQFIPAGQEILDNYLTFGGTGGSEFWKYVAELQKECGGHAGFIQKYEEQA